MKIKINVTKEVLEASANCPIRNGEDGFTVGEAAYIVKNCAISLAIAEVFPKAKTYTYFIIPFGDRDVIESSVNQFMEIEDPNIILLPSQAQDMINIFDTSTPEIRMKMEPMSFEIELSEEIVSRINIEEVVEILKTSKTMELVS